MSDTKSKTISCFFNRCPKEMSPNIQAIIKLCLKYITYDPNYNYDADDDEDDSMDIEDREDEDQGDFFDHYYATLRGIIPSLIIKQYYLFDYYYFFFLQIITNGRYKFKFI